MSDPFYTTKELLDLGFKSVGQHVQVSRKASIYVKDGVIGSNVRIDDFCILLGNIYLGCYIHIASDCYLGGTGASITMEDFTGLSHKVSLFTATDDYKGPFLSNATVPNEYKHVTNGCIMLCRGALVGTGSVILPNVVMGECSSAGALCIITKSLADGECITSRAVAHSSFLRTTAEVSRMLKMMQEIMSKGEN